MIGARLQELREDFKLTQQQLGDQLGLSQYVISDYERNKTTPSDETKIKLADYFGVSLDYLLGRTDQMTPIELDRRTLTIKVPKKLPDKALKELQAFLRYLSFSYHSFLK